jgi:leader peptidase (prepilin peptidase)/N-methyltransferase
MTGLAAAGSAAALAAAACGLAGALVPAGIARIPEPRPQAPRATEPDAVPQEASEPAESSGTAETSQLVEDPAEEPRPLFVDVAARPGLALRTSITAAVAGAVVGGAVGWDWPLLFLLPTVPVGVLLGYVDLRTKLLPSRVLLPAHALVIVLAGVCALAAADGHAFLRALLGMVAARSVFWVLWFIRSAGMGFGDVRLSALLGFELAYLGWGELVVGTYASFLLFGLPGLALAVARRDRSLLRTAFPFGPAMLAGALVGLVAGSAIWGHLVG